MAIGREECEKDIDITEFFEIYIGDPYINIRAENLDTAGDALEQIIFASNGKIRTAIFLFYKSLLKAIKYKQDTSAFVDKDIVKQVLTDRAMAFYLNHLNNVQEFIKAVMEQCLIHKTFRFYLSKDFREDKLKFITHQAIERWEEPGIVQKLGIYEPEVKFIDIGGGISDLNNNYNFYELDYGYCIANNIPTHYRAAKKEPTGYLEEKEIAPSRSLMNSNWIKYAVRLDPCDINIITYKTSGQIIEIKDKNRGFGFIFCEGFTSTTNKIFFHNSGIKNYGKCLNWKSLCDMLRYEENIIIPCNCWLKPRNENPNQLEAYNIEIKIA